MQQVIPVDVPTTIAALLWVLLLVSWGVIRRLYMDREADRAKYEKNVETLLAVVGENTTVMKSVRDVLDASQEQAVLKAIEALGKELARAQKE